MNKQIAFTENYSTFSELVEVLRELVEVNCSGFTGQWARGNNQRREDFFPSRKGRKLEKNNIKHLISERVYLGKKMLKKHNKYQWLTN